MDTPDPAEAALWGVADRLRFDIQAALDAQTLANPEGWRITDTRVFRRWTQVVELRLANDARTLCFILGPSDPAQPAFKRGRRFDVVYYSDDLAVADHGSLYARDKDAIERIARWLVAWDQAAAP